MYDSSKMDSSKAAESILLSPFRELKLIKKVGDKYHLRSIVNKEISQAMFTFCLLDYLEKKVIKIPPLFQNYLMELKHLEEFLD